MRAFIDTEVTKAQLIGALEAHQAADRIVQGRYWEDGKGCAVGCSLVDFGAHPSDHSAYEKLFGIPRVLARLEDGIFERLPKDAARVWPLRFSRAVKEGADLSLVWPRFVVWLLVDKDHGVVKFANEKSKIAIEAVAALYSRQIAGDTPGKEEFKAAAYAAYAADAAAAAAAAAADAYAADAYAAAAAAAYAAAAAAAYAAALRGERVRADYTQRQADKLIELIETADA